MSDTSSILATTEHRPYPLPDIPWFMFQQWSDLLFAHWAFPPEVIRPLVPEELELDLFDGKAWVGLTPFWMSEVHLRGLPPVPGTTDFLEMNLRTYVRMPEDPGRRGTSHEHAAPGHGANDAVTKPGIYFFSLDTTNVPTIVGARVEFGLPYFLAEMSKEVLADNSIHYHSRRRKGPLPGLDNSEPLSEWVQRSDTAEVEVTYAPTGKEIVQKSPLEIFLTERYCFYEVRLGGVVFRTDIHHKEWPLQPAEAAFLKNTVGTAHGIPLTTTPPLLHFAQQLDVLTFPPLPVSQK